MREVGTTGPAPWKTVADELFHLIGTLGHKTHLLHRRIPVHQCLLHQSVLFLPDRAYMLDPKVDFYFCVFKNRNRPLGRAYRPGLEERARFDEAGTGELVCGDAEDGS